ncbi:MAG: Rieske 2Fe-2S domain-containing protein [Actinobacteria bacterium]|nr:MAG: Rieske 2Fe-2S domain-containing protein [Actinomycetota bacterium]
MEPEHRDEPHTPAPTLYPIGFAAGIACVLVGLIVSPRVIAPIGGAIAIVFAFLWVRDATREYRGAPAPVEPETRREAGLGDAPPIPAHHGEAAMPEPAPGEAFPRSRFLEASTLGFGAIIGGLVTVPVAVMALGPAFGKQGKHFVDLGPLTNFPEGEWRLATFFLDPGLGEVTRRTAYIRNNGTLGGKPSFTIISNRCAHLGCPVQPNGPVFDDQTKEVDTGGGERIKLIKMLPAGGFGCPCHGGQYDPEGNRTAGPPVRALDRYEYAIKNGHLILLKTFSVSHVDGSGKTATIHKYRLSGPGQHIDGWEQIFYPLQPPQ